MGIEEEDDDASDWEQEEEPALTFVGDKTPELEVENDPDNGKGDEPDDINIVAWNNDKNNDNVSEQPELNFEVDKISEIDVDPVDEFTVDEPADDEPNDSATTSEKDFDITVTTYTPVSHNLESSLELSSSSSEEQVPLAANFAKRARVSASCVRARGGGGGRIRVRGGHV